MRIHRFDTASLAAAPWKNGGGTTREIAAWPQGAGIDGFDWRVSIATIDQAGPFSAFAGVDRVIMLLDGSGVRLRSGGGRIDHRLDRPQAPFAFAGLWDHWQQNGVSINSCAIVTTAANELLAPIHDRMPVILTPEAQDEWLRGHDDPTVLKELLSPYPAAEMKSHPVSRRVNYPDNDDQELVEPVALIEEPQTGMLFEL